MIVEQTQTWYALKTYYAQEQKVGSYLDAKALSYFIPMRCHHATDVTGKQVRRCVPAVHNLIFVRKTMEEGALRNILEACPFTIHVYSHADDKSRWYEIADRDILDLRLICDNTLAEPLFITEQEGAIPEGSTVRVTHGPLKGLRGRLVRKKKKYYVLKSFAGLGVMVAVSRWCCAQEAES